jgi:O-antigen biosynthesis protein
VFAPCEVAVQTTFDGNRLSHGFSDPARNSRHRDARCLLRVCSKRGVVTASGHGGLRYGRYDPGCVAKASYARCNEYGPELHAFRGAAIVAQWRVVTASSGAAVEPTATIIVVGWRDAPFLTNCLRSIAANAAGIAHETLVVLNEPSPRLVAELNAETSGVVVTSFRSNLGFGAAVNYAAAKARGSYIVLLNDDCIVESGWLEALIDIVERRPACGLAGSMYLHPDGRLQEAGSIVWADGGTVAVGDGMRPGFMEFERRVDYCSGASLLVRAEVWEALGGLDERYYPAYFEDVDMCLRAAELGWQVWYQPASRVRHVRSASSSTPLRTFLGQRGLAEFAARWAEQLRERTAPGSTEEAVWRAMGRPTRVLVIDDILPDRTLGSGFGRMLDTLEVLSAEPSLHIALHPRAAPTATNLAFARMGVRVVRDLEEHLESPGVSYDVVIISRPHNAEACFDLIREKLPSARIIFDCEALYHRRIQAQGELATNAVERKRLSREAQHMKATEESIVERSDCIVCVSEEEALQVRRSTTVPVQVVEPWLALPTPTDAPFTSRSHLGLVAGWSGGCGSPNSDGLLWFAREVMPRVRTRIPWCRLRVTGANPPSEVSWLEGESIEFVGTVQDLKQFYNGLRIAISPTRFGAGVKLKTVEAVQYGVPVVATNEGAAGLKGPIRKAIVATDDPKLFADAIVSLLTDETTWQRYRQAARESAENSAIESAGVGKWPLIVRETLQQTVIREVAR